MTELQVRQQFKNVTGMTAVEDIFIGLSQAIERQNLKDKIDAKFDEYSQYEFYKIFGFGKVYDKILTALADPKLKIKMVDMNAGNSYKKKVLTIEPEVVSNIIIHELVHAYNDLKWGGFAYDKDEAIATLVGDFFGGLMVQFISWENLLNRPNVTEEELIVAWNQLWYDNSDNSKTLSTRITITDVLYSYWNWEEIGSRRRLATFDDLNDIKILYGIYFSQDAILEYSRFKIPQGYNLPVKKSPFGPAY
jgi:hypothetical protein